MSEKQQAYISRVHLKGYKSIRDLEIDLKPGLNIIIGPNGSGKTNFLEFLENFLRHTILAFNPFETESSIELIKNNNTYKYELKIEDYTDDILARKGYKYTEIYSINEKKDYFIEGKAFKSNYQFEQIREKTEGQNSLEFYIIVEKIDYDNYANHYLLNRGEKTLRFDKEGQISGSSSIPQFLINNHSLLQIKISNFDFTSLVDRSVLALKNSQNKYKDIIDINLECKKNLNKCSPIKDIKFRTEIIIENLDSNGLTTLENLELLFLIENKWLRWTEISDGTKRLFYIITTLSLPKTQLILLEEPELGIHPDQLYKLMTFLKEQSKEKQIIITTHSPEVLNILGKDELDRIIVTRYDEEKGTQMHHLSENRIRKGHIYMDETGDLSDFWVHSNLEEYEAETDEN